MILNCLYLELTRNCTLECEHCLRGTKEIEDMDLETLENGLKDVGVIHTLLLTGGEPLLNINALRSLPGIIDKYDIKIDDIAINTNGTVFSLEHINTLQELRKRCNSLRLFLSSDLFHRLEWERLNIQSRIESNYSKYKEFFSMSKYLADDSSYRSVSLTSKGRAKNLSPERLLELNNKYDTDYYLTDKVEKNNIKMNDDYVSGKVYINVHGYVTSYDLSFCEEDESGDDSRNVNYDSLENIIYRISNNISQPCKRKVQLFTAGNK